MTVLEKLYSCLCFAILLCHKLEMSDCMMLAAIYITIWKCKHTGHKSGKIIYDRSKHTIYPVIIALTKCHQGLDGPAQDHLRRKPEANAWRLALVPCLSKPIQRKMSFPLSLLKSLLSDPPPHNTASLPNPFSADSCYAVLQSICLNSGLQNITTGNEADSIMRRGPLNHHLKNNF